jgi:hypothetical protein
MKKALLIAAGTVTGLGAVLSITPPALSDSVGTVGLGGGGVDLGSGSAPATTPSATPSASTSAAATPAATPTKSSTATAKPSAKPSTSATAVATPTATPTQAPTGFSGTVNGASYSARNYGTVSVSATFTDGKITSVSASQSPRSWSQQSLSVLLPYVNGGSITIEQVKQYSSAQLPCSTSNSCNSRASYTAEAFWASLKSAITKAGL